MRSLAACLDVRELTPGALRADIDLAGAGRARATRARLNQAMTELSVTLYARPDVRRVVAVVWTGTHGSTVRERALAVAAAEHLHARSEMLRGEPLSLAVVFADDTTPVGQLSARLRADSHRVPDGVAAMSWIDACTLGVAACAARARV